MAHKPRVLVDIKTSKIRPFSLLPKRINLHFGGILRLPLSRYIKAACLMMAVFYLAFGSVWAPGDTHQSLAAQNEEERRTLEEQLLQLESQIAEYETTVESYKKQGKTLQKEIDLYNAQISKLNLQIKAVNLSLQKLDQDIVDNTSQISTIENSIAISRGALTQSVRKVYESEGLGMLIILLKHSSLADFMGDINNLFDVQSSLSITLEKITNLRSQLLDEKEALEIKRSDAASLKTYRDSQKSALNGAKKEKTGLLQTTKGQESRNQEILQAVRKSAAQIRSRIFALLGGGELTFEEAFKFAKFAEQATGVRAALILAILDRESSFGQNVGRCSYQEAMHPRRDLPIFLELIAELRAVGTPPPEPITVSCPILRHGAYGGAMGPAQFIPSTWAIYKEKIQSVTGNNPANPWNNADAFVGTALYLKDAYESQSCRNYAEENKNVLPKQFLQERCASAKYYAGGRWYTYRFFYGDAVVERADKFQADIDILNS